MKLSGCTGQPGTFTIGSPALDFQAHATRRIARHGMDSAVGGACARTNYGSGFRRKTVDPFAGSDRLPGLGIGAEGRPVALVLNLFVRNGSLEHQNERI